MNSGEKGVIFMKKFLLLLTLLIASVSLIGCADNKEDVEYSDYNYLSLEINPKAEFYVDDEDEVVAVRYRNEEAEVVAAGLELVGKNYEEALQLYLNAAIDTGYVDVSRDDGAVMIQAGGKDDDDNAQFMTRVETKLQTFFQENAIGAVVLKNQEVDEEVQALVEDYDISYGFAKMVLAYIEQNEEADIDEVVKMQPSDLIDDLVAEANQYMNQYRTQTETNAQYLKDELEEAVKAQVQAHRDAVDNDTATQPDISGLKENYMLNFQSMNQAYKNRNQTRLQQAKDKVADQSEPMLFSVDINPGIDFLIDKNGLVMTYMLKNEAAEIVAAGLNMEGMEYQAALRLYLNAAIDTGYIDVERSDNAVMVQNSGVNQELENSFMNQTQTMLQTFFYENAIGAVVMNQHEIDPEIVALAEEYEISYGFAKLVLAYMATDETLVLESVLEMTASEILELLGENYEAGLARYKNQVEAGAQAIKDELVDALRLRVQEHRQAVQDGTVTQPDISGLRQQYLENYDAIHEGYLNRNQTRVQQAKNAANNKPE
jgi:hypothetical protein